MFSIDLHHPFFFFFLLLLLLHLSVTIASSASSSPSPPAAASSSSSSSSCIQGCSSGFFCDNCPANGESTFACHRYQTTNLSDFNDGDLPFNSYAWLTTHNAFAIKGAPLRTSEVRVTFNNQEDSITSQLQNGVRGLMLDMYDFLGDVWLCHSYGGVCYNYTAFEPAIGALMEVERFLRSNPDEVVTLFIEDYVRAPGGLTQLFNASGLSRYVFHASSMPRPAAKWPSLAAIRASGQRLLVFSSDPTKEASDGIAYTWRYVNENQYGDGGLEPGRCVARSESAALDAESRSLVLLNFFPSNPTQEGACQFNSAASLHDMLSTCYESTGHRWANYIALDFYKRSDGVGAFGVLDSLNARHTCGCSSIDECKMKLPYGTCNAASNRTTATTTSSASDSSNGSMLDVSDKSAGVNTDKELLLLRCIAMLLLSALSVTPVRFSALEK